MEEEQPSLWTDDPQSEENALAPSREEGARTAAPRKPRKAPKTIGSGATEVREKITRAPEASDKSPVEPEAVRDGHRDDRASGADPNLMTVAEVNRLAKQSLETISVSVQGEISGLNARYPYYVYFNLRDDEATLPAIMQKRAFEALGVSFADGDSVVVKGVLTLFEKQGKYQVRVTGLEPFGEGDIQRRIEALKRKLQAEGLFDDALKRALPQYPSTIGVVTSTRGAAIRDVCVTLGRRFPPVRIYVRGVMVQGEGSVDQICAGLRFFEERWPVDIVILARGGGSIQDLEPFSTEPVARTIASMRTPVVTGIGHEPDVSIADLVADRRGSTPTAAAEASVPESSEVRSLVSRQRYVMTRCISDLFASSDRAVSGIYSRPVFSGSEFLLGSFMQRLERAAQMLPESPARGLVRSSHRLAIQRSRRIYSQGTELISTSQNRLFASAARFIAGARASLAREGVLLEGRSSRLNALSPTAVLERGYSITFLGKTGRIMRSPAEAKAGDRLNIRLAEGEVRAEVVVDDQPDGRDLPTSKRMP